VISPNSPASSARLTRGDDIWIRLIVFLGGMSSIGTELSATHLIAPYFGESTFIWATVIGLTMTFLAIGYALGGRAADKYPRAWLLYFTTSIAAIAAGLLPFFSRPILSTSLDAFQDVNIGAFYGALIGVLAMLAVPITLLGFVTPYAIRLRIDQIEHAGNTAGSIYALSTIGSIAGSFLPVLVLIPWIGTTRSFLVLSLLLLIPSLVGLFRLKAVRPAMAAIALSVAMIAANLWASQQPIRAAEYGELIYETESSENYIQVTQDGDRTLLSLNDGHAVHSIYDPTNLMTGGPWDYFMAGPLFQPQTGPAQIDNALLIGLAGGTVSKQLTAGYGPIPIDGVELDPVIVDVGREYFDMTEPNLNVIINDGRYVLRTTDTEYDLIGVDAYRQPYIPFQLTTREFFREVSNALTDDGVAVMNVGRTETDYRLVDVIASTMKDVFPNVYVIDTERYSNSIVIATNSPSQIETFAISVAQQPEGSPIRIVGDAALETGNIREVTEVTTVFTDDHAPVERVIDQIIIDEALVDDEDEEAP
jgi:predicted membrane-bound spermidine synthase